MNVPWNKLLTYGFFITAFLGNTGAMDEKEKLPSLGSFDKLNRDILNTVVSWTPLPDRKPLKGTCKGWEKSINDYHIMYPPVGYQPFVFKNLPSPNYACSYKGLCIFQKNPDSSSSKLIYIDSNTFKRTKYTLPSVVSFKPFAYAPHPDGVVVPNGPDFSLTLWKVDQRTPEGCYIPLPLHPKWPRKNISAVGVSGLITIVACEHPLPRGGQSVPGIVIHEDYKEIGCHQVADNMTDLCNRLVPFDKDESNFIGTSNRSLMKIGSKNQDPIGIKYVDKDLNKNCFAVNTTYFIMYNKRKGFFVQRNDFELCERPTDLGFLLPMGYDPVGCHQKSDFLFVAGAHEVKKDGIFVIYNWKNKIEYVRKFFDEKPTELYNVGENLFIRTDPTHAEEKVIGINLKGWFYE